MQTSRQLTSRTNGSRRKIPGCAVISDGQWLSVVVSGNRFILARQPIPYWAGNPIPYLAGRLIPYLTGDPIPYLAGDPRGSED